MDLGLDIDGVLYPFEKALARRVEAARGLPAGSLPPATRWDFFLDWGVSLDEYHAHYRAGCDAGDLFTSEAPYPGAVAAVQALADEGHRIHYITARGLPDGTYQRELGVTTYRWLRDWGFPFDSLQVSFDKPAACRRMGVRVLLDDSPANYDALDAAGLEPILLDRPWNRDHPGRRVASLGALREFLLDIQENCNEGVNRCATRANPNGVPL